MKKYREEEFNKYNTLLSKLQKQCRDIQMKVSLLDWEIKHEYFSSFDDILPRQLTILCFEYVRHTYCTVCSSLYYGKECIQCFIKKSSGTGRFEFPLESNVEDMKCQHGCFKAIAENDLENIQYLSKFGPDKTCIEHKDNFYFQVARTHESAKGIYKGLHLPWKYLRLTMLDLVNRKPYFSLIQLKEYESDDYEIENRPNLFNIRNMYI